MFHHWLAMIHGNSLTALVVGFVLIIVVSFVPAIPIPVIAAAVGAACNVWLAILVTWSAASIGALLKFFVMRFLFQKHALQLLSRIKYGHVTLQFLESNGFMTVLIARLIPVVPSSLINLAGAVSPISMSAFVTATFIGKLPTMTVFTLAGNQFSQRPWLTIVIASLYVVILAWCGFQVRNKVKARVRS